MKLCFFIRKILRTFGMVVVVTFPLSMHASELHLNASEPVNLQANEILYDQELGLMIARGDVEIHQHAQHLYADTVTYNQKLDRVTASGSVRLHDAKGNIAHTSYAELSGDLKEGFIKEVRIRAKDESRFRAAQGARQNSGVTVLERVYYTPCRECSTDPNLPVTWHITAKKMIWDDVSENVQYHNAVLHIRDLPILPVPFLTHPAPTVHRRSGFLTPTARQNNMFGLSFGIPYFIDVSPSQNLTVQPFFFTRETPMLSAEYHHQLKNAFFKIQGSAAHPKHVKGLRRKVQDNTVVMAPSDRPRWHLKSTAQWNIDPTWRMTLKGNRLSDRTYYRHYNFFGHQQDTSLVSNLDLEGFWSRSYALIRTQAFQSLAQDTSVTISPYVLPLMRWNMRTTPNDYGQWLGFDLNSAVIYRRQGINTQRLSTRSSWYAPWRCHGHEFSLQGQIQADTYHSRFEENRFIDPSVPRPIVGSQGRMAPKAAVTWRYPQLFHSAGGPWLLQPTAMFIAAPGQRPWQRIPNEDSRDFQAFDDTHLFHLDRFPGVDRIDSGSRTDYGMELFHLGPRPSSVFLGQTYTFKPQSFLGTVSGFNRHRSDYVARATITPTDNLNVHYRSRFARQNWHTRWREISVNTLTGPLHLTTSYLFFARNANSQSHSKLHMIHQSIDMQVAKQWSSGIGFSRNLHRGHQLNHSATIKYKDDCLEASASLRRSFYEIPGFKPGLTVSFNLNFKNLGDVSYQNTLTRPASTALLGSDDTQPTESKSSLGNS
jgi:LPS-assembly protein